MKNAAPKLSDERCRQILAFACEARDKDTLFVNVRSSELEALAQEALDKRTAMLVLSARLDELEAPNVDAGELEANARVLERARAMTTISLYEHAKKLDPSEFREFIADIRAGRVVSAMRRVVPKSSPENDRDNERKIRRARGVSRK
jgi:hypothetical protein